MSSFIVQTMLIICDILCKNMYKHQLCCPLLDLYLFIVCFILYLFILMFYFLVFNALYNSFAFCGFCDTYYLHSIILIAFMQTDSFYQMSIVKYIFYKKKFCFLSNFLIIFMKFTATAVLSYSNFFCGFFSLSIYICEFISNCKILGIK